MEKIEREFNTKLEELVNKFENEKTALEMSFKEKIKMEKEKLSLKNEMISSKINSEINDFSRNSQTKNDNYSNYSKSLSKANNVLSELKKNLEKKPKEYNSYLRYENLKNKLNNLKFSLENHEKDKKLTERKKINNINDNSNSDDEEFINKYKMFKQKYLLKENIKKT